MPARRLVGVAYIIAFPTVFAYAASTWAVRRSSPALVAAYNTLQPLVAATLAVVFLGERFGWVGGRRVRADRGRALAGDHGAHPNPSLKERGFKLAALLFSPSPLGEGAGG